MNKPEITKLLTVIRTYDNRDVNPATIEAWHATVGQQTYEDARNAVYHHFNASSEYIMPVHINRHIQAERDRKAKTIAGQNSSQLEKENRIDLWVLTGATEPLRALGYNGPTRAWQSTGEAQRWAFTQIGLFNPSRRPETGTAAHWNRYQTELDSLIAGKMGWDE